MIRKLSDAQVAAFDKVHIDPAVRPDWERCLSERFAPGDHFRAIDMGGGNGVLADALLAAFPNCEVTVLDNSQLLLDRNQPNDRKKLVLASAEEIDERLEDKSYDLACFHWVLHHFVCGGYATTTATVRSILSTTRRKLRDGGRVSVFENMYDGLLLDDMPGKIIHKLTSSRLLAGVTSRLGANTAGVGVCFRSQQAWSRLLGECGYTTLAYDAGPLWKNTLAKRVALHVGTVRKGHFWLADKQAAARAPKPQAA